MKADELKSGLSASRETLKVLSNQYNAWAPGLGDHLNSRVAGVDLLLELLEDALNQDASLAEAFAAEVESGKVRASFKLTVTRV
jgi:hypothetical protein